MDNQDIVPQTAASSCAKMKLFSKNKGRQRNRVTFNEPLSLRSFTSVISGAGGEDGGSHSFRGRCIRRSLSEAIGRRGGRSTAGAGSKAESKVESPVERFERRRQERSGDIDSLGRHRAAASAPETVSPPRSRSLGWHRAAASAPEIVSPPRPRSLYGTAEAEIEEMFRLGSACSGEVWQGEMSSAKILSLLGDIENMNSEV